MNQIDKLKNLIVIGDKVLIKLKSSSKQTKSALFLPPAYTDKKEVLAVYVTLTGSAYPIPSISEPDSDNWKSQVSGEHYIPLQARPGDLAVFLQKGSVEAIIQSERHYITSSNTITRAR
ncbi:MAG: co-chaperone GroES [Bacteroidales bacterium]|nr:co-chaperone GroES [Bacteroidales bacterium]